MTDLLQAAKEVIRQISVEHLSENAVESLRQAINEAENAKQEPVAWIKLNEDGVYIEDVTGFPVYAAPVRTKDLTDDEIVHLVNSVWFLDELMVAKVNFARAVIAADREKNK